MDKYTLYPRSYWYNNIDLDQWCRDTNPTIDANECESSSGVPPMKKIYDPANLTVNYYMIDKDKRVAYSYPIDAGAPDEFAISQMLVNEIRNAASKNTTFSNYPYHPTLVTVLADKDDNSEFVELKKKYFSTFEDALDYEFKVRNKLEETYSQEWGSCSSTKSCESGNYGSCVYTLSFTCDYLKKVYKIIRTNAL